MLKFKVNKEKSNDSYEFMDAEMGDATVTILKSKKSISYSVFATRHVYTDTNKNLWYIEIWNHTPKTYTEAKQVAEKMYDIILWYKPPLPWSEQ